MSLSKQRLADHVYQQICDLILNGEIKPGQLITIQTLAESFDVSAIPVREAIQRLTGTNVLAVVSGRSVGIPPLTPARLAELTRVRMELEGATGRWAVPNITSAKVSELESLLNDLLLTADKGDLQGFLRANRAFHFTIYHMSETSLACDIIEKLWLQATPFFHQHYTADRYETANVQHRLIMRGIRDKDPMMVEEGIRNDIAKGRELSMSMMA